MTLASTPKAFLITPFTPESAGNEDPAVFGAVQRAIGTAAAEAGVTLTHPAAMQAPGPFFDQVREEIGTADVVLAFLAGSNRNVYLELGIALERARRPAILIARSPDDIPADIREFRVCTYDGDAVPDRLEAGLHAKLVQAIGGALARRPIVAPSDQSGAPSPPAPSPDDLDDLVRLGDNVRRLCAQQLSASIRTVALRDLGIASPLEPTDRLLDLPGQPVRALAPGHRLIDVLDKVGTGLLVLGRPGAGKTSALLVLGCDLAARVSVDAGAPTPVFVRLSTWHDAQPLATWLAGELSRYSAPERLTLKWLRERRLFLLLDGLDEVRPECRAGCVDAINAFVREYGVPGLGVSCRLDEYERLPVPLAVAGAVRLQPLSPEQVDEYLMRAGPRLAALQDAVRGDSTLKALASTPLMLDVMTLAYADLPAERLAAGELATPEARRRHVFATYVPRMFERSRDRLAPAAGNAYPEARTRAWLVWLAERMKQHAESGLLLERLQPSWLEGRTERWLYVVASRALGGVAVGLALGAVLGGYFGELWYGMLAGVLAGAIEGLVAGLVDVWWLARRPRVAEAGARDAGKAPAAITLLYVLALIFPGWAVIAALGSALGGPRGIDGTGVAVFVFPAAMLFALFFGVRNERRRADDDIRPAEVLRWSASDARRGGVRGLGVGAEAGIIVALPLASWQPRATAVIAAVCGAAGFVVGLAFGGLTSGVAERTDTPGQWVRLSARNALLGGGAVGVALGSVLAGLAASGVAARAGGDAGGPLQIGALGAVFFGLVGALWYGGLDVIQHYVLRFILAVRGHAPVRYARFLDHAASLAFLQKAGGGYVFVHRLLLEYFADGLPDAGAPLRVP